MSLERDVTGIMEASIFKPAPQTEVKRRMKDYKPSYSYQVIDQEHRDTGGGLDRFFDSKEAAIAYAEKMVARGKIYVTVEAYDNDDEDKDSETVWAGGDSE